MVLKRKRCPVLPVPHFLLSNVRHDVADCGDYQAAARTTCSAAELNRRPRYKRAMLALWLMTALGQTEKNSVRANVFRVAPDSGHCSMQSALRICANRRLIHRSKRHCCRPDTSGPELAAARQKANITKIRGARQLTDVPRIRH